MVRILKVRQLEERREALLRGSDLCREILHAEVDAISASTRRVKQRLRPLHNAWALAAMAAPLLLSLFLKRKKKGIVAGLLSGLAVGKELFSMLRRFRQDGTEPTTAESARHAEQR